MKLPAGSSWLHALLQAIPLCVGLLLGLPVAHATDDPPADTNAITSLTPEQAAKLAAEFLGAPVTVVRANQKWDVPDCLPLNGVTSLDAETAKALAAYGKGSLVLNGLTTLAPDVAAALAECKVGPLVLDGLESLSPESAACLAAFEGKGVSLNGLTTLSVESAQALARFKAKGLMLDGLTALAPESASALAEFEGDRLCLNGLASLSAESAAALAAFKGWKLLCLNGLQTLSVEAAKSLAGGPYIGELYLNGLKSLSCESAAALATIKASHLFLDGLTSLTPETAQTLAGFDQVAVLWLRGLTTLSLETATALAGFEGNCQCPLLPDLIRIAAESKSLTTASASLLARAGRPEGFRTLPGITAFDTPESVEVAEILATAKSPIAFPNLKRISPRTFAALVQNGNVLLPDLKTVEIIPEPDGSQAAGGDDFVLPDGFKERQAQLRARLGVPR